MSVVEESLLELDIVFLVFSFYLLEVILYIRSYSSRNLHTFGPATSQRLNAEFISLESRPTAPPTTFMIALFRSSAWSKAFAEKRFIVFRTTKFPEQNSLYTLGQTNFNFIKSSTWIVSQSTGVVVMVESKNVLHNGLKHLIIQREVSFPLPSDKH